MSANAKRSVICLPSFGCVTGLRFDRGGSAEVLMTRPELSRCCVHGGHTKPERKARRQARSGTGDSFEKGVRPL